MGCGGSSQPKEEETPRRVQTSPPRNSLNAKARAAKNLPPVSKTAAQRPVLQSKPQIEPSTMKNTDWKRKRAFDTTDPMDWTVEMVSSWLSTVQEGAFERYSVSAEKENVVGWQLLKFEKPDFKRVFKMKKTNHLVMFKLSVKKLRQKSPKFQADEWPPEAIPKVVVPEPIESEPTNEPVTANDTKKDENIGDLSAKSTQEQTVDADVQNTEEEPTAVKSSKPPTISEQSVKADEIEQTAIEPAAVDSVKSGENINEPEKPKEVIVDVIEVNEEPEVVLKMEENQGEEMKARKQNFMGVDSEEEEASKPKEVIETGLSKEEIKERKKNLLSVQKRVLDRGTSVDTGVSMKEMEERRKAFNNPDALDADMFFPPARSRASTTLQTRAEMQAHARANDIVEERMDFTNVKNFKGFEERKVQKTKTDADVVDAHKVSAFEGLKFREVKKDEAIQKDAEKLAGTKLVSKSVFHQMEHQPESPKKHQKSVITPRKIKKVKSVFHKMELEVEENTEEVVRHRRKSRGRKSVSSPRRPKTPRTPRKKDPPKETLLDASKESDDSVKVNLVIDDMDAEILKLEAKLDNMDTDVDGLTSEHKTSAASHEIVLNQQDV